MSIYRIINDNIVEELNTLQSEINERKREKGELNKIEAKIFYDHLISINERFVSNEIQAETNTKDYSTLKHLLTGNLRYQHSRMLRLKICLTEILSKAESSPSTGAHHPSLDLQLRKQIFLIKQIDSLEISNSNCPVRADVLYHHLNRLYDSFVANQLEIEAQIDGASLQSQQKIATEFQRKIIESQIQLKKIMASVTSTPSIKSTTNNQLPQMSQTQATDNLDTLLKKTESLIQRMASLVHQPVGEFSAKPAEELYHQFVSFDNSFVSNQNKIETEFNWAILNKLLETSKKLIQKQIDLQNKIKQIALSSILSSPTQLDESSMTLEIESKPEPESVVLAEELKTISNLVAKFDVLIESMWNKF